MPGLYRLLIILITVELNLFTQPSLTMPSTIADSFFIALFSRFFDVAIYHNLDIACFVWLLKAMF